MSAITEIMIVPERMLPNSRSESEIGLATSSMMFSGASAT